MQQFGGLGKSVRGIEQHLTTFIFILFKQRLILHPSEFHEAMIQDKTIVIPDHSWL